MIRRLGGGMRKYNRVYRGKSGIVREQYEVDRKKGKFNIRQRWRW